jgi:hypothetical protein
LFGAKLLGVNGQPGVMPAGENQPDRGRACMIHQDIGRFDSGFADELQRPAGVLGLVPVRRMDQDAKLQILGYFQLPPQAFFFHLTAPMEADLAQSADQPPFEVVRQRVQKLFEAAPRNPERVNANGGVGADSRPFEAIDLTLDHIVEVPNQLLGPRRFRAMVGDR